MSVTFPQLVIGASEVEWTDSSGARWSATLIWYPRRPADECEVQIDGVDRVPERVLCLGLGERRFADLKPEELELIRQAAHARSGIVWVDPRDSQLWWVRERLCDPSRVQPTYANGRWSGFPRFYMRVPITFLKSADHQRLLDDARLAQASRPKAW